MDNNNENKDLEQEQVTDETITETTETKEEETEQPKDGSIEEQKEEPKETDKTPTGDETSTKDGAEVGEKTEPEVQEDNPENGESKTNNKEDNKEDVETKADDSQTETEVHNVEDTGEQPNVPDDSVEDELKEPTTDELKAQVEEMEFNAREQQELANLNNLIAKGQDEVNKCVAEVQNALNQSFEKFGIDVTKTLDEICKEDAVKGEMAKALIRRANEVKDAKVAEVSKKVESSQDDIIYARAERELKKYSLDDDRLVEAGKAFLEIKNATGIQDLGEDLKNKVKYAVAKAKLDAPDKPVVDTPVEPTAPVEEPAAPVEEVKEPEKPAITEEVMTELTESPTEKSVTTTIINVDNVLESLASLPFKERTAFYKEHSDLIDTAMRANRGQA